ncbi:MAG: L,D-transpeptidase [Paracoccaceae bacterium]|jgi:lipoprotein-anchoring transpeptidase ErfK/SrfK|nr:L,D-transpeptidase [Paracoccaceae bacterium]
MTDTTRLTRRRLMAAAGATLPLMAAPAILRAQDAADPLVQSGPAPRRNVSSFVRQDWREHFDQLGKGAIVCDTRSRALHYWSGDETIYRLYPTSVPLTEELTRRGYTEVVRKKVGPSWTPTASMRERDPTLPDFMPAGPGNPLGTHAMYLSWPAYLIHGTHDTRKIGRRSSSGCIGLYNEQVEELFALVDVGTQVRLI